MLSKAKNLMSVTICSAYYVSSKFLRIIADHKSSFQVKSNSAEDLPQDQRISDKDILNNINTFMFAGSDTSSLAVTWTLYLLAQNPDIQSRLLQELLSISPQPAVDELTDEEIRSLYDHISNLSYLHNVTRESLRLIPPVHSSIRVATQDDEIPTVYPVHRKDGSMHCKKSITITKGTLIHVAIEGFNLDKEIWGDDAWQFKLRFRTLLALPVVLSDQNVQSGPLG